MQIDRFLVLQYEGDLHTLNRPEPTMHLNGIGRATYGFQRGNNLSALSRPIARKSAAEKP
jgi:hypothetical protein